MLINPSSLCKSLYDNGCFSHFFLPEKWDETLPVENIYIEDPAGVAETYTWEIPKGKIGGVSLIFEWKEYIMGVLNALQALYRRAAIDGNETAYHGDNVDFARYLLRARGTTEDYLFNNSQKRKFRKVLRIPVEPFQAKKGPGLLMNLGISGRELTFSLIHMGPDQFRHELEHLVFHDETTFSLDELGDLVEGGGLCWVERAGWKVSLERICHVWGLKEEAIILVSLYPYDDPQKPIVGFCREKEVLEALAAIFRELYPKCSLGHALKRYLRELR